MTPARQYLLDLASEPTHFNHSVHELERRLRVADMVLKFITVRIDETLKRLDKRKKERDKRAAKRAERAPAVAPAQPSLAQQMTEAPGVPGMPKEG